jgi:hypothetical protein
MKKHIHIYINNTYIDTHGQLATPKQFLNYIIRNRKLSELVIDVRVYRRSDIGSDHFLTLDKLRFSPKCLLRSTDWDFK